MIDQVGDVIARLRALVGPFAYLAVGAFTVFAYMKTKAWQAALGVALVGGIVAFVAVNPEAFARLIQADFLP